MTKLHINPAMYFLCLLFISGGLHNLTSNPSLHFILCTPSTTLARFFYQIPNSPVPPKTTSFALCNSRMHNSRLHSFGISIILSELEILIKILFLTSKYSYCVIYNILYNKISFI